MLSDWKIAVVGASGAVGREALSILRDRNVPAQSLFLFGSARSAGERLLYGEDSLPIEALSESSVPECDIALFCADAETARAFARLFVLRGAHVIDNSSAFRLDPDVPLVVPEINSDLLQHHDAPCIVANPNCSTIIMLLALEPIRRTFGVRSVVVSTYQAVSGAGVAAIDELRTQTCAALAGTTVEPSVFPVSCAWNVFPHESPVNLATGYCGEEEKMVAESRKIWKDEHLPIVPTCVRVPVVRAHSQSITIETSHATSVSEIESVLKGARGVTLCAAAEHPSPTPAEATGKDDIYVGRVRADVTSKGTRFSLWVCGDQLRKGAALNAVQIAEHLLCRSPPFVEAGVPPSETLRKKIR